MRRQRLTGLPWLSRLVALVALLSLQPAQAHLMPAQRGTLNLVGSGGFVVMALPVDAFTGIDDNGDGRLSAAELQAHATQIEAQVQRGLSLRDATGPRPLEAVMLNLQPEDDAPDAPAAQLVVLGRFALADTQAGAQGLTLRLDLYGQATDARKQRVTVTRGAERQVIHLAPDHPSQDLFPTAAALLLSHAALGATHVLGGLDHVLFLLLVLAAGQGWRQTVGVLTCFTAGHAITLAASTVGGLSVPAHVVEPAIAATLIGMALFDRWAAARGRSLAPGWRYALVFGCALIHGLGLAGALTLDGLDRQSLLLSLAGFNLGIEAAQVGVALVAAALGAAFSGLWGTRTVAWPRQLVSVAAVVGGAVLLVQRSGVAA